MLTTVDPKSLTASEKVPTHPSRFDRMNRYRSELCVDCLAKDRVRLLDPGNVKRLKCNEIFINFAISALLFG